MNPTKDALQVRRVEALGARAQQRRVQPPVQHSRQRGLHYREPAKLVQLGGARAQRLGGGGGVDAHVLVLVLVLALSALVGVPRNHLLFAHLLALLLLNLRSARVSASARGRSRLSHVDHRAVPTDRQPPG